MIQDLEQRVQERESEQAITCDRASSAEGMVRSMRPAPNITISTYTCTPANAHMHTCSHAHMLTCTHAHMHTCSHAHMLTCTHHTCSHAHFTVSMQSCASRWQLHWTSMLQTAMTQATLFPEYALYQPLPSHPCPLPLPSHPCPWPLPPSPSPPPPPCSKAPPLSGELCATRE